MKEAKQKNLKRYFTGKPCKNDHICERYVRGGCVECSKESSKLWCIENKEINTNRAVKWNNDNKDRRRQICRNWQIRNADKANANTAKRRATLLNATPAWLTKEHLDRIELFYMCSEENELTFGKPYEVDHIVPLQGKNVCGLHVPWNLQVITKSDNRSKKNKLTYNIW